MHTNGKRVFTVSSELSIMSSSESPKSVSGFSCLTWDFGLRCRVSCRWHIAAMASIPLILRWSSSRSMRSATGWHIHRTTSARSGMSYSRGVTGLSPTGNFWAEWFKNCESKAIVSAFRKCRFRAFFFLEFRSLTFKLFSRFCVFTFRSYSFVPFNGIHGYIALRI